MAGYPYVAARQRVRHAAGAGRRPLPPDATSGPAIRDPTAPAFGAHSRIDRRPEQIAEKPDRLKA
jgi:hypothetical protein